MTKSKRVAIIQILSLIILVSTYVMGQSAKIYDEVSDDVWLLGVKQTGDYVFIVGEILFSSDHLIVIRGVRWSYHNRTNEGGVTMRKTIFIVSVIVLTSALVGDDFEGKSGWQWTVMNT